MNRDAAATSSLLAPLLTALAYAAVGGASLLLATLPGGASPLYPAAGIALACTLAFGGRVVPGVALASFALNAVLAAQRGPLDAAGLGVAATIGAGAAAQALAGAALMRRTMGPRPTLSEPRDVARFIGLGCVLACGVSASVATVALWAGGAVGASALPFTWWTWWAGDTLGTLVGAPIALTLVGRPRADWAPRRATVGVSLGIAAVLLAAAIAQAARWDEQRARTLFERDAHRAADALVTRLDAALHALEAVHAVYAASEHVTDEEMRRATASWLRVPGHLQAIGYTQRVPRERIADFEAEARAAGLGHFRVFERGASAGGDADVLAVRQVEPSARNAGAMGVNSLSVAAARPALLRTWRSGEPVATAGFRLTQEVGEQTGVIVYHAVHAGEPQTDADRQATLRGAVFVALRMDDTVRTLMALMPAYLRWCLLDTDREAPRRRLAGAAGCETADDAFVLERALAFAGRQWLLRLSTPAAAAEGRHWNFGLFTAAGLLATTMFAALLLTVTGRTRRIEAAVAERTAALEHEVGERKRTEAALRESEQRFRNILDHVPIGVIYTDLGGRIRESNPKLREMVGYSADELGLMTATALTHAEDRDADAAQAARLLRGELAMARRQKRYLTKEGRTVWVQAVTTVLRDAAGEPQRLVGVVEDITEHLKLLDAERARERAEAANRAKSDFLSRMSHELRTPLNAMLGFAQLLDLDRQPALAPHQLEWTAQIQQAGWHLLHMINDTLDLSRIEAGTLKLALQPVDLHAAVGATSALLSQAAQRRGITVVERLDPQASTVLGDETRVKQVLTNLLSNAIKYNLDGGRVEVRSRLGDADSVCLEVMDTGIGMTPSQLGALFQPFNRLGREASATEGTGIGLVIARRLAELMGGTLDARSAAGKGSTFVLVLPRARAVSEGDGDDDAPLVPSYRQRLVHYVEDNETNAEVMRGILAQRPQVRLEISGTGLDGLAAIRQRRPSLVLLDMHLPDIDGIELLRHLKNDDDCADLPVVVVSADATAQRIEQALTLGAAAYLTKPLTVAQVLAVLDQQLELAETRFG